MAVDRLLDRNMKPKQPENFEDDSNNDDEVETFEDVNGESMSDDSADEDEDEESHYEPLDVDGGDISGEDHVAEDQGIDINDQIANVSFGALLQAQDALSRKRKRGSDVTAEQETKLEEVRKRLREIRSGKKSTEPSTKSNHVPKGNPSSLSRKYSGKPSHSATENDNARLRKDMLEPEDGSDSDSPPSEEEAPSRSRTSKHAPTTQSSKHQVTRKRTVVEVPKRIVRDPRFDALNQNSIHTGNSEKAYSFLRDYQKTEIAELRTAIKQARDEDDKGTLKRKLVSMENRLKSKEATEREQEVLRRHRKEEREKIEQGKKPFFLKRKDVKERALAEKFKGMKKKDQQKLIDKRKKKESQKEMKRIPDARRVAG